MWDSIAHVSSIFTLVAFLAAVVAWSYRRRLRQMERLARLAPEEDRRQVVETILDRVSVDTSNLTRQQRYDLALRIIENRSRRFKHLSFIVVTIVIVAKVISILAWYITTKSKQEQHAQVPISDPYSINVEPAKAEQTLILVADFSADGSRKFDIAGPIVEELTSVLMDFPNVSIKRTNKVIPREEPHVNISAFGHKYNALVLIWGIYDDAGIRASFAIPKTLGYSTIPRGSVDIDLTYSAIAQEMGLIADLPPDFGLVLVGPGRAFEEFPMESQDVNTYIRTSLPKEMAYLTTVTLSFWYYFKEKYYLSETAANIAISKSKETARGLLLHKIYYLLGLIDGENKKMENAMDNFKRSIAIDSTYIEAYVNIIGILIQQGKYEEAITHCSNTFGQDDIKSVAAKFHYYVVCGNAHLILKRYSDADSDYSNAINLGTMRHLYPKRFGELYHKRGIIRAIKGSSLQDALGDLEYSIRIDPKNPLYYGSVGSIYYNIGDLNKACIYFRTYLRLSKDQEKNDRVREALNSECEFDKYEGVPPPPLPPDP